MHKLDTLINKNSPTFKANLERMTQLVTELRQRVAKAREGGGAKYVQRHREQGKMPVRERIARLVDEGAPFLELSPLAGYELYDDETPGAGIVTGVGRVSGRDVVIVANDATVKGGTYYPVTVKKAPESAADRAGESPAVLVSRRFGWSVSPAAGRCLSGPRALRPHFLQSGAAVSRAHSTSCGGDGIVHGRRRVRAGDVR